MILSFKPQFISKILDGSKIHTIRADKHNRWEAGLKIQFATGARTKHYRCFKEGVCTGVQDIKIKWSRKLRHIQIVIDGDKRLYNFEEKDQIAINDGFQYWNDLLNFFFPNYRSGTFRGKIIHWTNFKY